MFLNSNQDVFFNNKEVFLNTVMQYSNQCWDSNVATKNIWSRPDGTGLSLINKENNLQFKLINSSMEQILKLIKIPPGFFNKNPINLQTMLFNYWIEKYANGSAKQHELLFRYCNQEEGYIRAILSKTYSAIDNNEVFPLIDEITENLGYLFRIASMSPYITNIEYNIPNTEREFEGKIYSAGVSITNSETGHSSVKTEAVIYINSNSLRSIDYTSDIKGLGRIYHRGDFSDKKENLKSLAEEAGKAAQVGIINYIENMEKEVEVNKYVNKIVTLPTSIKKIIYKQYDNIEKAKQKEIVDTVLSLAKSLPLFEQHNIQREITHKSGLLKNWINKYERIKERM